MTARWHEKGGRLRARPRAARRRRSRARPASLAERWQSGRMRRSRKPLWVQAHRGFESLPLRHRCGVLPLRETGNERQAPSPHRRMRARCFSDVGRTPARPQRRIRSPRASKVAPPWHNPANSAAQHEVDVLTHVPRGASWCPAAAVTWRASRRMKLVEPFSATGLKVKAWRGRWWAIAAAASLPGRNACMRQPKGDVSVPSSGGAAASEERKTRPMLLVTSGPLRRFTGRMPLRGGPRPSDRSRSR